MILRETIRCRLSSSSFPNYTKNFLQSHYLDSLILSNPNELLFLSPFNRKPISFSTQSESEISEENNVVANELRSLQKGMNEMGEGLPRIPPNGSFDSRSKGKRNLWALFAAKKMNLSGKIKAHMDSGNEDQTVRRRPLSSDMQMFTYHLYREGYFECSIFVPGNKFDATLFETSYARDFLKFVAVEFGTDHQEIAKWLNAVDLKRIALFGCPNLGYKNVDAAKNLRRFFEIEEHKVCENCRIKDLCKRSNIGARKSAAKLSLADVNRVLVLYGMDSVSLRLVVPNEIRNSVNRLLKEVIDLSRTVSRGLSKTINVG